MGQRSKRKQKIRVRNTGIYFTFTKLLWQMSNTVMVMHAMQEGCLMLAQKI